MFRRAALTLTFLFAKAASVVGVVYLSEQTWKKNRAGAIALMGVVNGISAAVVARNNHNASLR